METTRQKKVSRLLQKELSIVFQKEATQFCGNVMISITTVRVSPDLVNANIFLSVFPSTDPIKIIDLITKNKGFFRKKLGYRIKNQLRLVPELSYYLDDSASFAEKIDRLLKK
tara:strand:+ start:440 stop:778 length:339 start_codon:yes stop_codon:yes gene_type:complete